MKSIRTFSSYRDFLRATYDVTKKNIPNLSLQKYAKGLGLSSSTIKMILVGKRNLGISGIPEIARHLKLSSVETEYFEAMVLKERSKNTQSASYYARRLRQVKTKIKLSSVCLSKRELLSDPLILPVLVFLTDFEKKRLESPDVRAKKIAKYFNVDERRIERILSLLKESGALNDENYKEEIHYSFSKLTNILSQKDYLKHWLVESARRLETDYTDDRTFFNASTISLSPEKLAQMKSEMKALLEKYMSEPNLKNERTLIVQACTQMFAIVGPSKIKRETDPRIDKT